MADEQLSFDFDEIASKTELQQAAKLKVYNILREKGLRIPPDLQQWADENDVDGGPDV